METQEEPKDQNNEQENQQSAKSKPPQFIITENAKTAVYVNYSRLFFSDHDFMLELGQQLPAEEGNVVRINLRIAMTPQTAERLGTRLIRFATEYKKGIEKKTQQTETKKDTSRFNTTI